MVRSRKRPIVGTAQKPWYRSSGGATQLGPPLLGGQCGRALGHRTIPMVGKRILGIPYGEGSKRRKASRGIQVPSSACRLGPKFLLRMHRRQARFSKGIQRGIASSPVLRPPKDRVCEGHPHNKTFPFQSRACGVPPYSLSSIAA